MYNLGVAADLAIVFVFLGLVLESCKYLFSIVAAKAHSEHGKTGTALIYGSATALLMGVSFVASMASVDQASSSLVAQSSEYQQLSSRIETNQSQAIETRLAASELPSTYITKRKEMMDRADRYDEKASELLIERRDIKSNSFFVKYNSKISIMVAALVELVGLLLIPIFASWPPALANKIQRNPEPHYAPESLSEPILTSIPEVIPQLELDIRNAIIDGRCRPSHGGIRKMFNGVSSDKLAAILRDLGSEGIIEREGVGWKLV